MGSSENEVYESSMMICTVGFIPMALKAVIELDVLDIISSAGPGAHLSPWEIADKLPSHSPATAVMLDRILRALACHSFVTCTTGQDGRRYGLAPVGKFLVKNEDGVSVGPLVLMDQDRVLMESWYHLKDAILEGGVPFDRAHGMTAFEYTGTDPRFNKVFNKGMSNHSTLVMKKIMDKYIGFEGVKELVDVGGGVGTTLSLIVSKYPHIKGTNFDLKHVIEVAPAYPGVEHVGGDMFACVPRGEAIFMKYILHDWSDEHCLILLKNCHQALPKDGKVIIVDAILPEEPETSNAAKAVFHQDLLMLAVNPGGKERTQREFEDLAEAAGFSGFKKLCNVYNVWVMELNK